MKKTNNPTKKIMLIAAVCGIRVLLASQSFAQAPVSWTSYYEVGDNSINFSTGQPDPVVNLRSIAYNPINNNVYVYGAKLFNLPAQPSGLVFTKELGVVQYDNTGAVVASVHDIHHDGTTLIPRYDEPGEMAIAADGSVYVTGKRYYNDIYLYDMVVIKYSSALVEQWRYYFYSPGAANDSGVAIVIEPSTGNIIVAGQLGDNGTGTGADFITAKLTPSGSLVWKKVYNTAGTQNDYPADVALSTSTGDIYVTGYSVSASTGNQYTLFKYTSSGVKKWTRYYNYSAVTTGSDIANSVAVDPDINRIYITGTSFNNSGNSDIATLAYNEAGTRLWLKRINNPGDSRDRGVKVTLSQSLVHVGGDVDRDITPNINGDLLCKVYDSSGVVFRTKKYNGSGYNCEFGDLAVSAAGTIYMTGWCAGAVVPPAHGTYSLMTVKYSGTGAFQWSDFLVPTDFGCGDGYYGFRLALNTATSEAAVGGRHWKGCPGSHPHEYITRRYSPTLRESEMVSKNENNQALRVKLFPDPAQDHVTIETNQSCNIQVADISGKIIFDEKNISSSFNLNTSQWNRGVYTVIMHNGQERIVRKLVLQ
jgi:hypothetical protein